MTTQPQRNHNGNNGNTATSNNYWYSVLIKTTTTTTRGIDYNRNQYTSNGNAIYTKDTTTTTTRVNFDAIRGILHNILDVRNNALKTIDHASVSDKYYALVSMTKNMMYSLDLLLNNIAPFKNNDINVYNVYYRIMEQRQKLHIELQFMQYNVDDQNTINNIMKDMCNAVAEYNNDPLLLRVWYAKKHNANMQKMTATINKLQRGIDYRFSNNMQVFNSVSVALLSMSRY